MNNRRLIAFAMLMFLMAGCGSAATGDGGSSSSGNNTGSGQWGVRTKTSGCILDRSPGAIEDKGCSPGDIIPSATKDVICVPGYSSSVRNVPESEKNDVYAEYGVTSHTTGEYEVDHLISLELGGSNDISNLWPEPADPKPGFHEKDKVENYLHKQVCSGAMSLAAAQRAIVDNWIAVYNTMIGGG